MTKEQFQEQTHLLNTDAKDVADAKHILGIILPRSGATFIGSHRMAVQGMTGWACHSTAWVIKKTAEWFNVEVLKCL